MEKRNEFGFPDIGWMREYAKLPYDEQKFLDELECLRQRLPAVKDETLRQHYEEIIRIAEDSNEANKAVVKASECLVNTVELLMRNARKR